MLVQMVQFLSVDPPKLSTTCMLECGLEELNKQMHTTKVQNQCVSAWRLMYTIGDFTKGLTLIQLYNSLDFQ